VQIQNFAYNMLNRADMKIYIIDPQIVDVFLFLVVGVVEWT
jgi:hypothetical protein